MITRAVCPVLVGREEELSTLEDALLAACRGEGSVVLLAGDAGMGKSRLCGELERRADKIGAAVMEGSCSEADLALPYLPFLEAIGNYLETADVAELGRRLGVHSGQLAALFPQLAAEPAESSASTPDARLRLFEAVLAMLRLAAEERGLLLIVEDIHWADASTRELLDYLTRRLRNTRILVAATYRRDEMHRKHPLLPTLQAWQRSRLAQIVELEPLEPEGVARMVSAIFDDTDVGAEFRDFIHSRSEGNPFVLEEMLKAALDRGDIYRDGSAWSRKPLGELRIPDTVRDTILLRLERLDPEQVEILRCAAVLGRSFDHQTLIEVAAQDRMTVEGALQSAAQQQLLEVESGGRYRFRHALTQEAIYDDLSVPARERLHSAAADVLLQRPELIAEAAYHLRAANRHAEAVPASLQAAAAAEARFGYDDAASLYTLLLPLVKSGPERGRLLCRMGEALWQATKPAAALDPLSEGVGLLEAAGEQEAVAAYRLTLGRVRWETGDRAGARADYEGALAVLEAGPPSAALALAYIRLAGLAVFNLEAEPGRDLAQRAIAVAESCGATDMAIWALNFLGIAKHQLGEDSEGIALLERSASEAEAAGLYEIAGNALHNLFGSYLGALRVRELEDLARRLEALPIERWATLSAAYGRAIQAQLGGRVEEGLAINRELMALATRLGQAFYQREADTGISMSLIELDRLEEAEHHLTRPDADLEGQAASVAAWVWTRYHLAAGDLQGAVLGAEATLGFGSNAAENPLGCSLAVEALVRSGRIDEAESLTRLLAAKPQSGSQCHAAIARGWVELGQNRPAAAVDDVRAAIERFLGTGYDTPGQRYRLLLGTLLEAAGDTRAAESELRATAADCDALGMRQVARSAREQLASMGVVVDVPDLPAASADAPVEVGERLVTVLFADVRGYTAMTGQIAPAEMLDKISTYQRWAAQEVERHLGAVDKFAGDAVMATFNISGAQVDHARHAYQAAQALRDKAALLGLPVGVGIATGAAVVGRLKEGANLSVLGTTTNLAARLQAQAEAGEILLSEEARRRLPDVEAGAEQLELKGFDAPVTAYRVKVHAEQT